MKRDQLTATVRVLTGIGIIVLMLVFVRACFSPPKLPAQKMPHETSASGSSADDSIRSGTLPPRY